MVSAVFANRLSTASDALTASTDSVLRLSTSTFASAFGGARLRELRALQKARASIDSGSDSTSFSRTTPSRSWMPAAISAAVPLWLAHDSGSAAVLVRLSMYSARSESAISLSGEVLGAWTQTRSVGRKHASMQMRWWGEEKAKAWKKTERHCRSRTSSAVVGL